MNMKIKFHCNIFTTVQVQDAEIVAQAHLLDTCFEASSQIRAKKDTLEIIEAKWSIQRSPYGEYNASGIVDELKGVEAYVNAGPALRAATEKLGSTPRYLLTDCIAGFVLGELGVLKERGFSSIEEVDKNWQKTQGQSCYRFTNIDRSTQNWGQYVNGERTWNEFVFNRLKTATIYGDDDGNLQLVGKLNDSYHEISINLVTKDGVVSACDTQFFRYPDTTCPEVIGCLQNLVGKNVDGLTKKELGMAVGGPMGCPHFVDIMDHIKRTLTQSRRFKTGAFHHANPKPELPAIKG